MQHSLARRESLQRVIAAAALKLSGNQAATPQLTCELWRWLRMLLRAHCTAAAWCSVVIRMPMKAAEHMCRHLTSSDDIADSPLHCLLGISGVVHSNGYHSWRWQSRGAG